MDQKDIDKEKILTFSDKVSKKKFRISEFLAEKIITSIAFLSIAIIVLIFVFVFREALPIFYTDKTDAGNSKATPEFQKEKTVLNSDTNSNEKKSEYNSKTDQVPERYGVTEEISSTASDKPERYGVTEEISSTTSDKPERYGIIEDIPSQTKDSIAFKDNQSQGNSNSAGGEGNATFSSLAGSEWQPVSNNPRYGLQPLFLGTLKLTIIAILFAAPIGILAAIFTACFASKKLREFVKPVIELLAGFPSVVIGFFALMVMATFFQDLFGYSSRLNSFVGGIAMALAAIPIIYTIAEDALSAVPETYKEASLALGATKWQTAFFVTLPAATPGIFAAILLGVGRVFGETMIALMATGNAAMMSMNPFESVRALSATIGAEMAEVVFGDTHYNVLFLIGSLLFIITFILNMLAEFYIKGKLVKRFQGTKA